MTPTPAINLAAPPPRLTASAAVALTLLRDGYSERAIHRRTGITPEVLYPLAAAHHVTAPCSTVEGARCHLARSEDTCTSCQSALGRVNARALARQRRQEAHLKAKHTRTRPSRPRPVAARPSTDPASSSRSHHACC
jgi:RNA polymerase sigma-70 factor (ECF subfamily)